AGMRRGVDSRRALGYPIRVQALSGKPSMRRRTFLAAIPAAAAAPAMLRAQAPSPVPAPIWTPGEVRFDRPDVHGGDRPVGASFASRSVVYGLSGAAGSAQPLATQAGIEILKK